MAVGIVASATSGSQASVATFNIGTLGTGARAGIVFVATHGAAAVDTGVTWNSVAMTLLYSATDTDTEPGAVRAYFLDNVSNGVITVSRTNNATVCVGYAASISAASACIAAQTITRVSSTQNTNASTSTTGTGASGEVAVTDGSPGTNSMRFAAFYTGAATPLSAGTNSTSLQTLDSTSFGSTFVRETTAGQGSRNVGAATGTTDDWAIVAVAVAEKIDTNPAPSAASMTLTGATPTVVLNDIRLPTAASMTLTGATPTVVTTNNVTAQPTAAAMNLTGATPAVATPVVNLPTAAAMTLTGATPAVATPVVSLPTAAALVLTLATPAVVATAHVTSLPTAASLVLTGDTPAVATPVLSLPTAAALAFTLATPDVAVSASDNKVALPTAAALVLTGATPDVLTPVVSLPTLASLVLAGDTPAVTATNHVYVTPGPLGLVLTGAVPTVLGASAGGGRGGRGGPRRLPDLPGPDADEAYLLLV